MILEEIYNLISKTENARIVFTKDLSGNNSLKKYERVISIETELSLNEGLKIVHLYIALTEPYSVNLPKIFIDDKSYEQIKYLPHVNHDLSICIIDENENFNYDIKHIPNLVLNLISDAKKILRGKDDKDYLREEFEREFTAYWNINYSEKNELREIGLCLVDFENLNNIKAVKFLNRLGQYQYLVYNVECKFNLFKNYIKLRGIKFDEIEIFFAEYTNVNPPFKINYKDSLKYLTDKDTFREKINKFSGDKFIVVFKGSQKELFGWTYSFTNKKAKGYRQLSNWQFLNSALSSNNFVDRLYFSDISPKRLDTRTAGDEIVRNLKLAVIGVGSVGSNLLHYLMKYPVSKYCLIDSDILKVENVYRNYFGFNFISRFKTKISEYEILSKNPFTKVITNEKDICEVLSQNPEFIEDYDFRFLILGVTRIEKYIIQHLISIKSDKPIFVLWVEPYLASGQMIYLLPKDFQKGIDLLENYPYHVIKKGQQLLKKEGSCQTGYMPYSDINLSLFLSAINPIIYSILNENKNDKSQIFGWIGNLDQIKSTSIEITDNYKSTNNFTLLEHEL
ncbi:E2/UBC family protein [Halpernia sp.]|uniref:E2/UBC family protein n=1 Tax=Halpernia sp. TaxID=2782209 RepID=UPI003A9366F5